MLVNGLAWAFIHDATAADCKRAAMTESDAHPRRMEVDTAAIREAGAHKVSLMLLQMCEAAWPRSPGP